MTPLGVEINNNVYDFEPFFRSLLRSIQSLNCGYFKGSTIFVHPVQQ